MGDFTYEDMADASKSQMMWKIANKTIDQKRKRISYLETRVKRLNKKVQTLTDLLMLFKKEKGEVSITTRHLPNLKQFTRD